MQNPVYNGVNVVMLDCQPADDVQDTLCTSRATVLAERMRLPVKRLDSANPPAPDAPGILRITLEAAGNPEVNRYRLVWFNDRKIRGGPVCIEGNWVDAGARHDSMEALVQALVATRP